MIDHEFDWKSCSVDGCNRVALYDGVCSWHHFPRHYMTIRNDRLRRAFSSNLTFMDLNTSIKVLVNSQAASIFNLEYESSSSFKLLPIRTIRELKQKSRHFGFRRYVSIVQHSETVAGIIRDYEIGMTLQAIGDKRGLSKERVRQRLESLNIIRRKYTNRKQSS